MKFIPRGLFFPGFYVSLPNFLLLFANKGSFCKQVPLRFTPINLIKPTCAASIVYSFRLTITSNWIYRYRFWVFAHINERTVQHALHSQNFQLAKMFSSSNHIKYHTPTTYRSQRRLNFSASTSIPSANSSSATLIAPLPPQPPLPNKELRIDPSDNNAYTLEDFIQEYGGSTTHPPTQWQKARKFVFTINSPTKSQSNNNSEEYESYVLPWENAGSKISSLFRSAPPKLKYPAGSRNEDINNRFCKRMDHYLFRSFHVRDVLVDNRPHPFSSYKPLQRYWQDRGTQDWTFDTTKTFATLDAINQNGDEIFYRELSDLLWFGGVVSYGNILRETYAILYGWISEQDLPDIEGLCEEDDGYTFRKIIIKSLKIVRPRHTQELIARLYRKLDQTALTMRPGGMAAYFAKLNLIRIEMKKQNEMVSESYMLHRTYMAVTDKHQKLEKAVADMRRTAGVSHIPTTFVQAKEHLIDTFDFEIPDGCKTEKAVIPTIPINLATGAPYGKRKPANTNGNPKRPKRTFPKGSCKHCPQATDHTTPFCYIEKRKQKGLPDGWQWCTFHPRALHYEHCCFRHRPNYPPVPSIAPASTSQSAAALQDRVVTMLGLQNVVAVKPELPIAKPSKIVITPAENQQLPRMAHGVPTNSASQGPPVTQIFERIMTMSKPDRLLLATRLSKAGF